MKLNIINDKNLEITGYNNIDLLSKTYLSQISELIDYSCEEIIVSECINALEEKELHELFQLLCTKLSLNGEINITTYDIEYMCTLTDNTKNLNAILPKINSFISAGELKQVVNAYNIHIMSLSSLGGLLNMVGLKVAHETNQ